MNSPHASLHHDSQEPVPQESITEALALFNLTPPLSQQALSQRYQDLLLTWHPHRYANITNNPSQYMHMYKKGEVTTKKIRLAHDVLKKWLDHHPAAAED